MMVQDLASEIKNSIATDEDFTKVAALLGRSPRGLQAVVVRSRLGEPVVIQVASLVDKKPFPTLFWLVDKRLNYAIDQLEASGVIAQFQSRIDESEAIQETMANDHKSHIKLRHELMLPAQIECIETLGFADVFKKRGIGGIENFTRIRCLHTYYASHLVEPNSVGKMLDAYWQENNITFEHL